jgi:hypothetical protein
VSDPGENAPTGTTFVDGKRAAVRVTGIGYKLDDLPRAFGQLSKLAEHDFFAVLKPQPPNEYNETPIEVWVNGVHIGWVNDGAAPRHWKHLMKMSSPVSCGCVVKTTAMPVEGQGYQVAGVWLSFPYHLWRSSRTSAST